MNDTDELYPWEQKDDETEAAYHAFLFGWRDQKLDDPHARRTLTEAARRIYDDPDRVKVPNFIRDWYDKWEWRERAKAWDRYLQRREDEALASGKADAARNRGTTLSDLESKQLEAAFEIADVILRKWQDPDFRHMILPKDTTAGARAVTEFMNAMLKHRAETKDETTVEPLSEKELSDIFDIELGEE